MCVCVCMCLGRLRAPHPGFLSSSRGCDVLTQTTMTQAADIQPQPSMGMIREVPPWPPQGLGIPLPPFVPPRPNRQLVTREDYTFFPTVFRSFSRCIISSLFFPVVVMCSFVLPHLHCVEVLPSSHGTRVCLEQGLDSGPAPLPGKFSGGCRRVLAASEPEHLRLITGNASLWSCLLQWPRVQAWLRVGGVCQGCQRRPSAWPL